MAEIKKIVLVCTAGVTTGLLVNNMKEAAAQQGLEYDIQSVPAVLLEEIVQTNQIDALLVGPYSNNELDRIHAYLEAKAIHYKMIPVEMYETLDGEQVIELAQQIV